MEANSEPLSEIPGGPEVETSDVSQTEETRESFNQEEIIQHDDVTLSTVESQYNEDDDSTPEIDTSLATLDTSDTLSAVESQLRPESELPLYDESQIGSEVLGNITIPSAVPPLPFDTGLEVAQTSEPTLAKFYPASSVIKPSRRGPGRPRKDGLSPVPRKAIYRSRPGEFGRGTRTFLRSPRIRGTGRRGRPAASSLAYRQALQSPPYSSRQDLSSATTFGLRPGVFPSRLETSINDSSFEGRTRIMALASSSLERTRAIVDEPSMEESDTQGQVHLCSFCNCGERSLLGQGELCYFEPTPGFNPFKRVLQKTRRGSAEQDDRGRDKSPKPLTWRRTRHPLKISRDRSRSPRHSSFEDETGCQQVIDELNVVGFPEDIEISQVFEATGHCWSHHCCAAWSEGVTLEEQKLQFVDRAVFAGLTQKCSYCRRFGATIPCRGPQCHKRFHYPCASAGGCFQDIKTLSLLCGEHFDQAEMIAGSAALCVQCGTQGNIAEQLFCTNCGDHYHGNCLCPPVEVKPTVRAGWQCPNCKICQTCRQPGDDSKMLVCDICDKGYHTFCLKPAMTTIPKNGWKCKNCRICTDCGARTPGNGPSSRWHLNYTVCDSCYQQRNKGLCCPLCGKAYRTFHNKTMVQCNKCKKFVHSECDLTIDASLLKMLKDSGNGQTDYVCSVCRDIGPDSELGTFPVSSYGTEESLEGFPYKESDPILKDDPFFGEMSLMGASSQESLYTCEDSSSSIDIDTEKASHSSSGLATYMAAKAEMLEGHMRAGRLPPGRKKIGAGRPRTRPLAPEKRRRPLSFGEKRRGPKTRVKTGQISANNMGNSRIETDTSKDDSGDDHPSTIVLANSKDSFTLDQDVCKSCGAFGRGEEGKMIVCTQCGQCYHPYCASVKVTKVVLKKGWRCLDCTVCEGCGSPHDEGRLLLCDECDISYHTYCLDPPLEHVPKGTWKCKWCVICQYCGSKSPGVNSLWQNNYTQCAPCASKITCPACRIMYREDDLIIQCINCDRWLHSLCDGLTTEDEAELAADYGYHCLFCRPETKRPGPLPPPPPPPPPPEEKLRPPTPPPPTPVLLPPPKEPELPKQFLMDGVYLSASGIEHIQSLSMPIPKKPRQKRTPKKLDQPLIDPLVKHPNVARLLSMSSVDGEESMEKDTEDLKTPDSDMTENPLVVAGVIPAAPSLSGLEMRPDEPEDGLKKRRPRKQTGLGVGGFVARQRSRTTIWKRQTQSQSQEDLSMDVEGEPGTTPEGTPHAPEKQKRRRRSRKSKLEESFPTYLQEAFFGKSLLDTSKESREILIGSDSEKEKSRPSSRQSAHGSNTDTDIVRSLPAGHRDVSLPSMGHTDDPHNLDDGDLKDILPGDLSDLPPEDDILKMFDSEGEPTDSSGDKIRETPSKDELDMLTPDLGVDKNLDVDKMLSDVNLGPNLDQIDSKMVEDIFKGVLQGHEPNGPETAPSASTDVLGPNQFNMPHPPTLLPGPQMYPQDQGMPRMMGTGPAPMMGMPIQGPNPQHVTDADRPPGAGPLPSFGASPPFPPGFGPQQISPGFGPKQAPPWALDEVNSEEGSSRRNIIKWEADEALGLNATISSILYVNMNHPELKTEYTDWPERAKQIAKLWRKLTPEEKQPYLAKARKNRTSSRVLKAQKAGEFDVEQVSQELRRRQQEAQMREDSQAMPPPPAPPPLPSPGGGQMPGVPDQFPQLSPQEGRRPIEGPIQGMLPVSPRHGGPSPGRSPLPGMEGEMSPLHSPGGLGSPRNMPQQWPEESFNKCAAGPSGDGKATFNHPSGIKQILSPDQLNPARQPNTDAYAFQPSTPRPDFAQGSGTVRLSHPPRQVTPQAFDPYAHPPNTPHNETHDENGYPKPPGTPGIPQVRKSFDQQAAQQMSPNQNTSQANPYLHPPGTPRMAGPQDPFASAPGTPHLGPNQQFHGQSPNIHGQAEPMVRGPRPPVSDPYAFPSDTARPAGPQDTFMHSMRGPRSGMMGPRPRFSPPDQMSPGIKPSTPEQFQQAIATSTPSETFGQQHPETQSSGASAIPQQTPLPSTAGKSPHSSPGPLRHLDLSFPGGQEQFRHPHPQIARSQSLPDPYSHQPGTPQPGLEPSMISRSVTQMGPGVPMQHMQRGPRPMFPQESALHEQLFGRRRGSVLSSGTWSFSYKHPFLGPGDQGEGDRNQTNIPHQQLREILAQQIMKKQKEEMIQQAHMGGHPQWPPSDGSPRAMGPRPQGLSPGMTDQPVSGSPPERWPLGQRLVRPPNPAHFGERGNFLAPRGPYLEGMRPRFPMGMRQLHPPISDLPQQGHGHAGGPFPTPQQLEQMPPAQRVQFVQALHAQGLIPPGHPLLAVLGQQLQQHPNSSISSTSFNQQFVHVSRTDATIELQRQSSDADLSKQLSDTQAGSEDDMFQNADLKRGSESSQLSHPDGDQLQLPDIDVKVSKPSMSEDEKHEDDDLLSFFTGADGTFDILKYADPELNLDDDKILEETLDFMDETKSAHTDVKTEDLTKLEGMDPQTSVTKSNVRKSVEQTATGDEKDNDEKPQEKGITDFQAKFLEFSQKRAEEIEEESLKLKDPKSSDEKKEGQKETKDSKTNIPGVSHIAALLQGTEPIGSRQEREERMCPDSLSLGSVQRQGLSHVMSPLQGGQHTPIQMSPSGAGISSPRSGQHSPRTPNMQSPFNQLMPSHSPLSQPVTPGQQLSPFSSAGHSPFSPPVASHSPFSTGMIPGSQSPFPSSGASRAQSSVMYTMAPQPSLANTPPSMTLGHPPFPLQHSPRGTITPTNQYAQGTYGQPPSQTPRNTLTPTPESILYGQSAAAQQVIRQQGPGQRMPFPPSSQSFQDLGQPQNDGQMTPKTQRMPGQSLLMDSAGQHSVSQTLQGIQELSKLLPASGGMPASSAGGMHPVMMGPRPEMGMPGAAHPNLQQQLAHAQGNLGPRGMRPFGPGQQRLQHPSMRMQRQSLTGMSGFQGGPGGSAGAGPPQVSQGKVRPGMPQKEQQHTLLDELLEQEKLEQKRQLEQQALLRRETGKLDMPGGMRPGLPPPSGMNTVQQIGPRMEHGLRMQSPETPWPGPPSQTSPQQGDSPQFPGFSGRPPTQQLSPRTPSPFQSPSPGMQAPRMSPLTMLQPPPQPPIPPPPGELGPEYHRQMFQYEDWLTKQAQFLDMQIKLLEQQIQKQKRAKKTIQARQRQAKKVGNELNPSDVADLERISGEQSGLQKQLESLRKQQRQHQMQFQDYRNKQKEVFGRNWPPNVPPLPPPTSQQQPPVSQTQAPPPSPPTTSQSQTQTSVAASTAATTTAPTTSAPRSASTSVNSVRMTRSDRQEYDAYMQQRLRLLSQGQATRPNPIPGPRLRTPTPTVPDPMGLRPEAPKGQTADVRGQTPLQTVIGDNNPFSEGFQQREQLQRFHDQVQGRQRIDPTKPASGDTAATAKPEAPGPVPFFRERGSFEQGPRFQRAPGPGHFPETGPRHMFEGSRPPFEGPRPAFEAPRPHFEGARPPFDVPRPPFDGPRPSFDGSRPPFDGSRPPFEGPRPGFTGGFPQMPGSQQVDQIRMQGMPMTPGPHSTSTTSVSQQSPQTGLPVRPPPPVTSNKPLSEFPIKPQSETERRILEILSNSAALAQKEDDSGSNGNKSPRGKSPASSEGSRSGMEDSVQQQMLGQAGITHHQYLSVSLPGPGFGPGSTLTSTSNSVTGPRPRTESASSGLQRMANIHMTTELSVSITQPTVHISQSEASSVPSQPMLSVAHTHPVSSAASDTLKSLASEVSGGLSDSGITVRSDIEKPKMSVSESSSNTELQGRMNEGKVTVSGPEMTKKTPEKVKENEQEGGTQTDKSGKSDEEKCGDGIHCGTDDENESNEKPKCDDGIHCGTDDENESNEKAKCSDGIHCGTDDENESNEKAKCNDGIHCGTDDENESNEKAKCDDGIHCGTDDEDESTTGKTKCDDGVHCGTDDEDESTAGKTKCDDGVHCGTDDEDESTAGKTKCDDGIHCGTDDEDESIAGKTKCDDGVHCGTDDEDESTAGKTKCDDGVHCGTDDESESTAGKTKCDDGIHCGTDDEDENNEKTKCSDGVHCGTDDENDDSENKDKRTNKCNESKKEVNSNFENKTTVNICNDETHCGTDNEQEHPPQLDSEKAQTSQQQSVDHHSSATQQEGESVEKSEEPVSEDSAASVTQNHGENFDELQSISGQSKQPTPDSVTECKVTNSPDKQKTLSDNCLQENMSAVCSQTQNVQNTSEPSESVKQAIQLQHPGPKQMEQTVVSAAVSQTTDSFQHSESTIHLHTVSSASLTLPASTSMQQFASSSLPSAMTSSLSSKTLNTAVSGTSLPVSVSFSSSAPTLVSLPSSFPSASTVTSSSSQLPSYMHAQTSVVPKNLPQTQVSHQPVSKNTTVVIAPATTSQEMSSSSLSVLSSVSYSKATAGDGISVSSTMSLAPRMSHTQSEKPEPSVTVSTASESSSIQTSLAQNTTASSVNVSTFVSSSKAKTLTSSSESTLTEAERNRELISSHIQATIDAVARLPDVSESSVSQEDWLKPSDHRNTVAPSNVHMSVSNVGEPPHEFHKEGLMRMQMAQSHPSSGIPHSMQHLPPSYASAIMAAHGRGMPMPSNRPGVTKCSTAASIPPGLPSIAPTGNRPDMNHAAANMPGMMGHQRLRPPMPSGMMSAELHGVSQRMARPRSHMMPRMRGPGPGDFPGMMPPRFDDVGHSQMPPMRHPTFHHPAFADLPSAPGNHPSALEKMAAVMSQVSSPHPFSQGIARATKPSSLPQSHNISHSGASQFVTPMSSVSGIPNTVTPNTGVPQCSSSLSTSSSAQEIQTSSSQGQPPVSGYSRMPPASVSQDKPPASSPGIPTVTLQSSKLNQERPQAEILQSMENNENKFGQSVSSAEKGQVSQPGGMSAQPANTVTQPGVMATQHGGFAGQSGEGMIVHPVGGMTGHPGQSMALRMMPPGMLMPRGIPPQHLHHMVPGDRMPHIFPQGERMMPMMGERMPRMMQSDCMPTGPDYRPRMPMQFPIPPSSVDGSVPLPIPMMQMPPSAGPIPRVPMMQIKQEPKEEHHDLPGRHLDLDSQIEMTAEERAQNAMLKQLLAKTGSQNTSGDNTENEELPDLTPEQRRQLEMIDEMPLCKETEISPEEWEMKTPEEREKILEIRRQEYERRRKEYENLRKQKKGKGTAAGETKRRRKRQTEPGENLQPGMTKKRAKKQKGKDNETEDRSENFMQQLRNMPAVPLREPAILVNNFITPLHGTDQEGGNLMQGSYGRAYLENVPDIYGSLQLPHSQGLRTQPAGDIASRRHLIGESDSATFTDEQRYHLMTEKAFLGSGMGQTGSQLSPFLHGDPRMRLPVLPPHPRVEPRGEPPLSDSPDTVISSSSPECSFSEPVPDFPSLRPIDLPKKETERISSPVVPILHPIPIKSEIGLVKSEIEEDSKYKESKKMSDVTDISISDKKEMFDPLGKDMLSTKSLTRPFMDPGMDQQVSVTLTLSATAAEDIGGVMSAIADLLKIAVPPTYEMTRSPSPDSFRTSVKHKEEAVDIKSLIKAKPKFCRHCDVVVLSSGIRKKKSELAFLVKEDQENEDEELIFCSMNCYMQFAITNKTLHESEPANIIEHKSDSTPSASPLHLPVTSALSISTTPPVTPVPGSQQPATPTTPASSSNLSVTKSPLSSPMLSSPSSKPKLDEKPLKKHRRSSSTSSDIWPPKPPEKKWKDVRWKKWSVAIAESVEKREQRSPKKLKKIWRKYVHLIKPEPRPEDTRTCAFCLEAGDGHTDSAARLLNMDVDKWTHLNCALWSYDVYETVNGALMNVDVAYTRSQTAECVVCHKKGATLSCFKVRCTHSYHLVCAKNTGCVFFQDKTLLCSVHAPKTDNLEGVLDSLVVFRRVYINRDEDKQIASMIHQDEGSHILRVGSLTLHSVGQLLPHQIQTNKFNTREYIYPVGFKTSRFYWSMRHLYKRCRYICSISDIDGGPEFTIRIQERDYEDIVLKDVTPKGVWSHILEPLQKIRKKADLVKMFPTFITGEEMFGLTEPNILKVIESLPGTDLLNNYYFKFGRSPLIEMPLAINPTGAARTEPKMRTHYKRFVAIRRSHTLQSSGSRSLPTTVTGITGDVNLPYIKQFVHSKSQQYRRLKTEWKTNVFLARSRIQGLGLYAARDLEKHTMVIEYIGDLIRNEVANRREKMYDIQNRGVYMFRIDDDTVVDATMAGGPARYINHSCSPNCVAEVVQFEKESKIIIITSCRISKGEELTYDYKFDFEDDQHKIPCLCGAPNCRKWMN